MRRPGNLGDTHFWFGNTSNFGLFSSKSSQRRQQEQLEAARRAQATSIANYMMSSGAPISMASSFAANDRNLQAEIQRQYQARQQQQRQQVLQAEQQAKQLAEGVKRCGPAPNHQCSPPNCISLPGRPPCPPIGGGPHQCIQLPGQSKPQWVCNRRACPHCETAAKEAATKAAEAAKAQQTQQAVIKTTIAPASTVAAKAAAATPATATPAASSQKEEAIRRCVNNLRQKIAAKMITTVPVCGRGECTEAEFRAKCGG